MYSTYKPIFSFPSFTVLLPNTSWYWARGIYDSIYHYYQIIADLNAKRIRINVSHVGEILTKERAGLQVMCEIYGPTLSS